MVYVRDASGSVEAVCEKLKKTCADNAFGVLGVHDLKEKMNSKGVEFHRQCLILEVCNPKQARDVLEADMAISTALPCRISVYEEDGHVRVATLKPTALFQLFNNKEMAHVARKVEETLVRIIDTACA